mmetsp:Transcript_52126/g.134915  ORF Transcript_52126/g.134915 Transcript_52126/m.134915 type:complete len:208 (+) Transcript_52126:260-883(+)
MLQKSRLLSSPLCGRLADVVVAQRADLVPPKPFVDAIAVEVVTARELPQLLAHLEVQHADRATRLPAAGQILLAAIDEWRPADNLLRRTPTNWRLLVLILGVFRLIRIVEAQGLELGHPRQRPPDHTKFMREMIEEHHEANQCPRNANAQHSVPASGHSPAICAWTKDQTSSAIDERASCHVRSCRASPPCLRGGHLPQDLRSAPAS